MKKTLIGLFVLDALIIGNMFSLLDFGSVNPLTQLAQVSDTLSGKTYYVDTTGLDTSPGTQSLPFKTIQKCANVAIAGDTCLVGAGTYNERVSTKNNGTSLNPITFIGQNANVPGGFSINTDYIIIKDFEIANGYSQYAIYIKGSYCQILDNHIHDSQTTTWDEINFTWYESIPVGCKISGNRFNGSVAYGGDHPVIVLWGKDHVVENNEIGPMLDIDAFRAFGSGFIIRNNYIHDIAPSLNSGAHTDVFQTFYSYNTKLSDFTFEKNIITDFNGQVFMLSGPTGADTNITFSNNLYSKVALQGQTYLPIRLYNNTFSYVGAANGNAVLFRKSITEDSSGSIVKNNLFYKDGYVTSHYGFYGALEGSVITADYNLVYPAKTDFAESHGINGSDPLFVNALTHDLHLSQSSPAINTGTLISEISSTDIVGVSRPKSTAWDMGAYEYSDTVSTPTPDTISPSIPTGLSANVISTSQINLSWNASTDDVGVSGYKIYRNGNQIKSVTATTYQDIGLTAATNYIYTISAYDAALNNSNQSTSINAKTQSVVVAPPTITFAIGDRVHVTTNNLSTRATANGKKLGTQPLGALGTIIGGPTTKGSYTWWKIDYDSGVDGWSVQNYLAK